MGCQQDDGYFIDLLKKYLEQMLIISVDSLQKYCLSAEIHERPHNTFTWTTRLLIKTTYFHLNEKILDWGSTSSQGRENCIWTIQCNDCDQRHDVSLTSFMMFIF